MFFNLSRRLGLLVLGASLFTSLTAQAGISVVVTASPPLREVIVEPAGYTRCYIEPQGFYRGVWHYRHRVCEYAQDDGLQVWVSGYWQCVNYLPNGRCMRNAWIQSHWAVPVENEYRVAYQRYPGRHYGRVRGNYHGRPGAYEGRAVIHSRPDVYARPPIRAEQRPVDVHAGNIHGHQ